MELRIGTVYEYLSKVFTSSKPEKPILDSSGIAVLIESRIVVPYPTSSPNWSTLHTFDLSPPPVHASHPPIASFDVDKQAYLRTCLRGRFSYQTSKSRCPFKQPPSSSLPPSTPVSNSSTAPKSPHSIMSSDPKLSELFDSGLKLRREVVGDSYVNKALQNGSSDFAKPMQELVTEMCWGKVWNRPGLERKQRSLLNIGMLSALNRGPELGNHIRGAINNGLTHIEIREALLQVAVYVGMPAGLEGFKIAERVINEMVAAGEYKMEN
ncbi:MAG: hypothetical protein M1827_007178 [Pycnora praestabilis]|nr:MAG: hypothetical protein M1827_007178 [Pycnora praestabilis]